MTQPASNQPDCVGIVLATYNCDRRYFAAQIQSIKEQDYPHWRCLITDDGSTPAIQQFIQTTIQDDKRFIYHLQSCNLGSYHNFEYGIRYFSQDERITHLAFADQDDIWRRDKLTQLLTAIATQEALLVHSDLALIDGNDRLLHSSVWTYEKRHPEQLDAVLLLLKNSVTGCTILMRRQLIPHVLPFPEQPQGDHWYHDHWLAVVAAHLGSIAHIREALVHYRQHGSNVIGAEQQAGTIRKEIELWLAKKGRLTLKSYRIHRDLSTAFFQRFYPAEVGDRLNPFSENKFDFGLAILKLGCRSIWQGYGAQGITLRIWLNKFIFDLRRLKIQLSKPWSQIKSP